MELEKALRNLDQKPLENETLHRFFVDRDSKLRKKLTMVMRNHYLPKYLLTGYRGAGKSSELAKLDEELTATGEYCVVRFSVRERLDVNDLTHIDVLLAMVFEVIRYAQKHNIVFEAALQKDLEKLWSFGRDIEIEIGRDTIRGAEAEFGVDGVIGWLLKLSTRFKVEHATREVARQKVEHRLSDLYEGLEKVAKSLDKDFNKGKLMFIVEDLDKMTIKNSEDLFYFHADALTTPRVIVIYTFPVALKYSNNFQQIVGYFNRIYDLPNFKTRDKDGNPQPEGVQCLHELVAKRVPVSIFEAGALDELIDKCGGITRMLVTLLRNAVLEALADDRQSVTLNDAKSAIAEERKNFQYTLNSRRKELLAKVMIQKDIENTDEYGELLHNLSVVQYSNGEVWYDVHPIMKQLL